MNNELPENTTSQSMDTAADTAAGPAASTRAIGLDVGTSRIVVATGDGNAPQYRSQLNAFVDIPLSQMTLGALRREGVPHTVAGEQIIVQGNESANLAGLLNAEIRRPMTRGVLDASEPDSLRVIGDLLSNMLGGLAPEGTKVVYTIPAAPLGAEGTLTFHSRTLAQMLDDLGFQASSINEGLAVVYSELQESNYTGIGVSCGGGLCNVCLSYLSVPVLSFSIPKAGDFIDSSAAAITGERANRIRLAKEDSFHLNGFFTDKTYQVINVYYEDMLQALITGLKEALSRAGNLPRFDRPIPLVLSGGTAMPAGFRDRFAKLLEQQKMPLKISEIRLASDPLNATAKGALQCALSELEGEVPDWE